MLDLTKAFITAIIAVVVLRLAVEILFRVSGI